MWLSNYKIFPRKKSSVGASTKAIFPYARPITRVLLAMAILLQSGPSFAQQATVSISVKSHQFQPAEIHAPANTSLAISVKNLDAAPMEFESVSLRVEKVIAAGSTGVVNVRPLSPGRYEFYDDFHQETRGFLMVR
jgi:hypothetical protein